MGGGGGANRKELGKGSNHSGEDHDRGEEKKKRKNYMQFKVWKEYKCITCQNQDKKERVSMLVFRSVTAGAGPGR